VPWQVLALARLVFEFAQEVDSFRDMIPNLLTTVLLLGTNPNKEVRGEDEELAQPAKDVSCVLTFVLTDALQVIKSVVSFVRVCVAACPPERLEPMLPGRLGTPDLRVDELS
jgi:hypothetical protein